MNTPAVPSSPATLLGRSPEQIREELKRFGQPAYRATQIYKWLHHHQVDDFEQMTNLPKSLREALRDEFVINTLQLAARAVSVDGTIKYLWRLPSGLEMESVYIPDGERKTVCISSQVGCAMGCTFCATGKMGFLSNLSSAEIVEQVIRVQQDTGQKITNVVLMGMGEPFLNYPRVMQACQIMADPEGLAIAAKKITVSTVGIVPKIYQFTDEKQPFSLAISLHAATQSLRQKIMPLADKFYLDELMESAAYYTRSQTRKRITFEYVLLEGVNDTPDDARALIRLLSPLRCKLNLIPYNDTGLGYANPSRERFAEFAHVLENAPFAVMLRKSRGTDVTAACGQLVVEQQAERAKPRYIQPAG